MKQFLLCIMLCSMFVAAGQTFQEFNSFVSDEYVGGVSDVKIIREINGGTVFRVKYSSECTYEMQGAFEYACKIVEEYLPPCLPITISVNWDTFRGSGSKNMLSKISIRGFENFTDMTSGSTSYMPHIKRVLLKEYEKWVNHTFIDSIPNVSFLYDVNRPDITISYNRNFKSEFSYSIDTDCGNFYDFISLAIRDIVRGLGFVSHFTYNPAKKTLAYPSQEFNPFEAVISKSLGRNISDSDRLVKATQGSLSLPFESNTKMPLELYAPETYENGISLNYFIPDSIYAISNVLSYEFGRGTVCRDLNDEYADDVFRSFLGWKEDIIVSSSAPSFSQSGSNSNFMPFNGTIEFEYPLMSSAVDDMAVASRENAVYVNESSSDEIKNYINKFHCYYSPNAHEQRNEGTSISLLKKDGTWDVVYHSISNYIGEISFADWTLSFSTDEYARTCDGYLRARITTAHPGRYESLHYVTRYFVIDYLPQTVEIQFAGDFEISPSPSSEIRPVSIELPQPRYVRINIKNIEGLTRVVAEKKRSGFRLPTKTEITDFKKGYFIIDIDDNLINTITVVGYNANGSSRSLPIEISASSEPSCQYTLVQRGNELSLRAVSADTNELKEYEILSLNNLGFVSQRQPIESVIDVSGLSPGYYVIRCFDDFKSVYDYKFIKK